ncbi:MAG TPA: PhnD/SsuA/transferrin family substrate-binding protein [Stellaceae bacterium]|nr:PhnD/SsuA/transferrin family substrate-binding protein [Stellaceae bacterium]
MRPGLRSFGFERPTRRAFVVGAAATAVVGVTASSRGADSFSFGLTPLFLDNDIALLSMLERYLTRRLERPVALVKRRTYHEISAMLLSGQLDAAWICDDPYVQYHDQLTLLAVPVYRHRPLYQTYVIVNEASQARSFDDIRGTVHAFSDPDSTSGYLVTRWMLALRETTPARFFHESFFCYGHRNVIRAVGTGLAESGSIDGYVWDVMGEREPELVRPTRVVFRSEWLGFPPIVAPNGGREAPAVKALAASLLDMPSDPEGREILAVLALDGFIEGTPDMYESTAEKVRIVKAQV